MSGGEGSGASSSTGGGMLPQSRKMNVVSRRDEGAAALETVAWPNRVLQRPRSVICTLILALAVLGIVYPLRAREQDQVGAYLLSMLILLNV